MLRHVVFIYWKAGASEEGIQAVVAGLKRMPEVIPSIRRYDMGADLGLVDGAADFTLVADFDSAADWKAYQDHPQHRSLIDELFPPVVEKTLRAQFMV